MPLRRCQVAGWLLSLCLLVPVRSGARFLAASAQHGFKPLAIAAESCNLCCVLALEIGERCELAACNTLGITRPKASRSARLRHLPPSRDEARSAPLGS